MFSAFTYILKNFVAPILFICDASIVYKGMIVRVDVTSCAYSFELVYYMIREWTLD